MAVFPELSIGNEIRKLGDYIRVLHIHDNMGDRDSHLYPTKGITDWYDFVNALDEIGYKGVLSLETSPFPMFTPTSISGSSTDVSGNGDVSGPFISSSSLHAVSISVKRRANSNIFFIVHSHLRIISKWKQKIGISSADGHQTDNSELSNI